VSLELTRVKSTIFKLSEAYTGACRDVTDADMVPFAQIADLARAIAEAEQTEQQMQREVTQAEAAELAQAPADLLRKRSRAPRAASEKLESDIRTLARECDTLRGRLTDLKSKLTHIVALAKRAEGHLPESSRNELPDLSVPFEELEASG
jgi:hypothetical protein